MKVKHVASAVSTSDRFHFMKVTETLSLSTIQHMETLQSYLKQGRKAAGDMSQEALADMLGMTENNWNQIEGESRRVSAKVLKQVANILNLDFEKLMNLKLEADARADADKALTPEQRRKKLKLKKMKAIASTEKDPEIVAEFILEAMEDEEVKKLLEERLPFGQ
jgi:transcriptional regulator with XRE-family HTH domain